MILTFVALTLPFVGIIFCVVLIIDDDVFIIGDVFKLLLLLLFAAIKAAYSFDKFISVFLAFNSLATLAFCFFDMRPNLTASFDIPSERHFCNRQY